jgi:hypothetical protein
LLHAAKPPPVYIDRRRTGGGRRGVGKEIQFSDSFCYLCCRALQKIGEMDAVLVTAAIFGLLLCGCSVSGE